MEAEKERQMKVSDLKSLLREVWDLGVYNHDNPQGGFEIWYAQYIKFENKLTTTEELQSLRDQLADKEQENAELIKANKLLTKKCAEYMMRLAGNPEI